MGHISVEDRTEAKLDFTIGKGFEQNPKLAEIQSNKKCDYR